MTVPSDYEALVLVRFEGDKDLLCEVVQLFLDDSPQSLEAVRTAVAARDAKMIFRTAHTLKGSISNFLPPDGHAASDDPARRAVAVTLELERLGAENQLGSIDAAFVAVELALTQLAQRLQKIVTP